MAGEPLITVVGNLVADPEHRTSQNGNPWVTFRVASTPRVRDRQSGDWSDGEALWLGCRAYGEYASNIARSLTKGSRVLMQGRLTARTYKDANGVDRTGLDFEVEEIGPSLRFATATVHRGGGGGGGNGGSAASAYGAPQTSAQSAYGGQQQPQGQAAWGAPPQQQQPQQQQAPGQYDNPWASNGGQAAPPAPNAGQQQFGTGFDDEQPF